MSIELDNLKARDVDLDGAISVINNVLSEKGKNQLSTNNYQLSIIN